MRDEDDRVRRARLGIEAETFLRSTFGKFMIKKADAVRKDSIECLVDCEPGDLECNTRYRNQITSVGLFKSFIKEAVNEGINAHQQLEDEEALSKDVQ